MSNAPPNAVEVDFTSAATYGFRPEDRADQKDGRPCGHNRVFVVGKKRCLECRDCGQVIDAFDFLMRQANEDLHVIWAKERLSQEADQLRREINRLKRARAKLRRGAREAGEAEAMDEMAYIRRDNAHLLRWNRELQRQVDASTGD